MAIRITRLKRFTGICFGLLLANSAWVDAATPEPNRDKAMIRSVEDYQRDAELRRERIERARHFVEKLTSPELDTSLLSDAFRIRTATAGYIERTQYLQNLTLSHELWKVPLTFDVSSILENQRTVVIEASSSGVLFNNTHYGNSYLFVVEFDQDQKIHHVLEIYDPARIEATYRPAIEEFKAQQKQKPAASH